MSIRIYTTLQDPSQLIQKHPHIYLTSSSAFWALSISSSVLRSNPFNANGSPKRLKVGLRSTAVFLSFIDNLSRISSSCFLNISFCFFLVDFFLRRFFFLDFERLSIRQKLFLKQPKVHEKYTAAKHNLVQYFWNYRLLKIQPNTKFTKLGIITWEN